ncbi:hypothetical protein T02_14233, partial [Trichinella nativa]
MTLCNLSSSSSSLIALTTVSYQHGTQCRQI